MGDVSEIRSKDMGDAKEIGDVPEIMIFLGFYGKSVFVLPHVEAEKANHISVRILRVGPRQLFERMKGMMEGWNDVEEGTFFLKLEYICMRGQLLAFGIPNLDHCS